MSLILYKKLSDNAVTPNKASEGSVGFDLYSPIDVTITANSKKLIYIDLAFQFPKFTYGRLESRSGLALNHFIIVVGGIIDNDYRSNIGVILYNLSSVEYHVNKHDRIAQIIIQSYISPELMQTNTIEETARGGKGFGSSGQ